MFVDGDLNNLHKQAGSPAKVRASLKEIKGAGDVAVDIMFDSLQSLWTDLAPFLGARDIPTAQQIGIGSNVRAIYAAVGNDPRQMCRVARGLSQVRLDKKTGEFR